MRQGFFAVLGGDPLKGALAEVEGALLEYTGGRALWLVPYPLRDLAEAWRLAYKALGLKEGRILALKRREEAFDEETAAYVSGFPLVLMAAEEFFEFLDLLAGSLLKKALEHVRLQGGVVATVGEGAGLLG
ncbi:MAG: cyanophycinase, partial [Thermaceae bacterium]